MTSVTVLMPVYNAEKYLGEAVESILAQTYSDFEFIVINDGSTDRSESILQEFQRRDRRIRVVSRSNTGYVVALNEGLGYANGRYIARMDADDIALPDRFVKQVAFLEANQNYVAVGSRVLLIDSEGLPISPFFQQTSHEEIDTVHMAGCSGSSICHPTAMLCRDALQSIGGYRKQMEPAEDLDLFLQLAEIGKLANLSDVLLKYRLHPKSVGHSRRAEQKQAAERAVIEAHHRRGFAPPMLNSSGEEQPSVCELHRTWAWWSLNAGNVATARKHALLTLGKNQRLWSHGKCLLVLYAVINLSLIRGFASENYIYPSMC